MALTGCQTPEPEPEAPVRKAQEVTAVHVHSLPPGCFIELNNEFLGVTPMTIRVPSYEGKWRGSMYELNRLRVSMPRGGGLEEKNWFGYDRISISIVFGAGCMRERRFWLQAPAGVSVARIVCLS